MVLAKSTMRISMSAARSSDTAHTVITGNLYSKLLGYGFDKEYYEDKYVYCKEQSDSSHSSHTVS